MNYRFFRFFYVFSSFIFLSDGAFSSSDILLDHDFLMKNPMHIMCYSSGDRELFLIEIKKNCERVIMNLEAQKKKSEMLIQTLEDQKSIFFSLKSEYEINLRYLDELTSFKLAGIKDTISIESEYVRNISRAKVELLKKQKEKREKKRGFFGFLGDGIFGMKLDKEEIEKSEREFYVSSRKKIANKTREISESTRLLLIRIRKLDNLKIKMNKARRLISTASKELGELNKRQKLLT